jgi:hypothetical protein
MAKATKSGSMSVIFDPKTATSESVHKAVDLILSNASCTGCGRLSKLDIEFVSSSPANTKIPGVISVQSQD